MKIIDGKKYASTLLSRVARELSERTKLGGVVPGLTVVLVGEDAASQVYVRNKEKRAKEAGFSGHIERLSADTTQNELLSVIERLNADDSVHGILVQLPLPKQIDEQAIIAAIAPMKDVDGFHEVNSGRLMNGSDRSMVPCTPKGCVHLIKSISSDLSGMHAVIVGRSNIVGKPLSMLLLRENCTVTIAHSKTRDLPALCRTADILVAAVGVPELVKGDWVRPGAIVIDVGINRIEKGGRTTLVGDIDFESAKEMAGAITPVPGGVGPMTIACLLENTLQAATLQQ